MGKNVTFSTGPDGMGFIGFALYFFVGWDRRLEVGDGLGFIFDSGPTKYGWCLVDIDMCWYSLQPRWDYKEDFKDLASKGRYVSQLVDHVSQLVDHGDIGFGIPAWGIYHDWIGLMEITPQMETVMATFFLRTST